MENLFGRVGPILTSLLSSVLLWIEPITNSPQFQDLKEIIGILLALVSILWMVAQIDDKLRKRRERRQSKKDSK